MSPRCVLMRASRFLASPAIAIDSSPVGGVWVVATSVFAPLSGGFEVAQAARHGFEDRVRADRTIRLVRSERRVVEREVERPRGALGMRHEGEYVAVVVADAGRAMHGAVVSLARVAQHDAAALFEIIEVSRVAREAAFGVRCDHTALIVTRRQVSSDSDVADQPALREYLRAVADAEHEFAAFGLLAHD